MKILKFILPVALAFSFAGCLDIDEKIDVKKDGSGTLIMDMDMSQVVEMMQTYMGKEELEKKGMVRMDTTINLKDLIDSVPNLTPEKKALLSPGSVHIKLDIDSKVFTVHILFPFTSQANLQKLYAARSDGSLNAAQLFSGLGSDDKAGAALGGSSPDIDRFNGIYNFTSRDGLMTKTLNADKWKALQNDPEFAQIKQAGQMGMEINYTTTITLPRPVKKIDNPLAKLSEDKKTVLLKFNLIEAFDHPENFGYNIEY
jgi:hypothetical protein